MKTLIRRIKKILVGRRLQGQLRRVISVIACVVVFATTYALVLPAITMESLAQCGIEAHEHTAGCYEKVLVCGQEETGGHSHTDECWQTEKVLVCEIDEHTHGPECRDAEGNLTCEKTEHVHDENCYREEKTLICGMEEAEGHTHTDACYEDQLICGKEVHIHSPECYENNGPSAEEDIFAGGDVADFTEDNSMDSSFTGDGFTDDGFIDNEFTDNGFADDDFTDGDITFTDGDWEYTEAADFGGADEFTEAAEAEDGSGFLETQGLEDGTVFEDPAGAEGGPAFEDPAYAENGSYYEDQETNNGYDDTAYVEEIADGAVSGDAGEALEDENADPGASDAETPDGTDAVNPDEAGISTDSEGSTLNEDPSGQDGQEQNPDGSAGTDADKEVQSGEEAGEAGTDKTDITDTEAGTDRTAEAGAAGTQAQDGTAAETEKTEETEETKETEAAGPEGTETDAAGADAALADQTETEDKHEAETAADGLQAPADLERFLTDRTGIWYYPAVFDEDGKADTADINSETVTDWKRVEEDTVLSPEDFVRIYIAYTLPAGTLSETNPVARYTLPAGLHLTPAQVEAINTHENGYYLSLGDGNAQTGTGAPGTEPQGYLGAEAVEGTRTPDQAPNGQEEEYISAVVKAEEIYDEDGNLLCQELVFTFLPYTVEKNGNVYADTNMNMDTAASGSPDDSENVEASDDLILEGKAVSGFLTVDFSTGQIDFADTETDNIKTAEITFARENETEGIGLIRENLTMNSSADFRKTQETGTVQEGEENSGSDKKEAETPDDKTAGGKDTTSDEKDADKEKEKKKDLDEDPGEDTDKDAERKKDTDHPADLPADAMPARTFEDSITLETARPASVGESGTVAEAAGALPARSEVKVRVEADEGTFPAGTTMVLSAVDSKDMDAVAEAVENAVANNTDADGKKNSENTKTSKTCGFQAVDISFRDADGNEIEPVKPVRVVMTSSLIKEAAQNNAISAPVVVHVDNEGKGEQIDLIDPEKIETAKGRTEEDLIREAEDKSEATEEKSEEAEDKSEATQDTSAVTTEEAEIKKNAETDKATSEDSVGYETDCFSVYAIVYTVDFHWEVNGKEYEFSIPGGGFVSLQQLVEVLGMANSDAYTENAPADVENSGDFSEEDDGNRLVEKAITLNNITVTEKTKEFVSDVGSVECSSPGLVWVGKVENSATVGALKNANGLDVQYTAELTEEQIAEINSSTVEGGDWALISMQPFMSEETLTVTMKNGDQCVVRVTDAQISTHVLTADGITFKITVTYDDAARIPEGTRLVAEEIEYGSEEYLQYLGRTWSEVNRAYSELESQKEPDNDEPVVQNINVNMARFFDIKLFCQEDEIEPKAPVQVEITYVDGLMSWNNTKPGVVHFTKEGNIEVLEEVKTDVEGDAIVSFRYEQDSFSVIGTYIQQETHDVETPPHVSKFAPVSASAAMRGISSDDTGTVEENMVIPPIALRGTGEQESSDEDDDSGLTKPTGNKTLVPNEDGTYTLTLSVKGHSQSVVQQRQKKANVLFVMDRSSSMITNTVSDEEQFWYYGTWNTSNTTFRGDIHPGTGYQFYGLIGGRYVELNVSSTWSDWYNYNLTYWNGSANVNYPANYPIYVRSKTTRLYAEQDALNEVINNLLSYNTVETPDTVEIALISFAYRRGNLNAWASETEHAGWVTGIGENDDLSGLLNAIDSTRYASGTNWEEALQYAYEIISAKEQAEAEKPEEEYYVIFLTDGEPTNTARAALDNESAGNMDKMYSYNAAKDDARNLAPYHFYNIFTYRNPSKENDIYSVYLTNYAYSQGTDPNGDRENAYVQEYYSDAQTIEALNDKLGNIFQTIADVIGHADVSITDTLTTDAMTTTIVQGKTNGYVYTVKDSNGTVLYTVTATGDIDNPAVTFNVPGSATETYTAEPTAVGSKTLYSITTVEGDEYRIALADVDSETGELTWDLSPIGILMNDCTYSVSFVVWPDQEAYDYVAGLNNGLDGYIWDTSPANEDYQDLTDTKGYEIGGVSRFPSIVRYSNGTFAVLTNKDQKVHYSVVEIETVNGEPNGDPTIHGPYYQELQTPSPMELTASETSLEKAWSVDRNPGTLAQLLYDEEGNSTQFKINYKINTEEGTYTTLTLGWDDEKGVYAWEPSSVRYVTYNGHRVPVGMRWTEDFAIATGLMLSEERMDALGMDKTIYPSYSYGSTVYYILETGHDYTIEEIIPEDDARAAYEFDFIAPVYHPMLVDGKLKSVTFNRDGENAIVSIKEISKDDWLLSLKIENTLRGYIKLEKDIVDKDGRTPLPEDETEFEYTIELRNSTDPGPFTIAGSHVPWYGVDGLFYHTIDEDDDFHYYQAVPNGEGHVNLTDEDGNTFDATCIGTFAEDVGPAEITYTDGLGTTKTIQLYGNEMVHESDNHVWVTMKINQNQVLDIANVPVGSTYTITETDEDGYRLVNIRREIRNGDSVETGSTFTGSTTVSGRIVSDRDNHITYTNKPYSVDLTVKKADENNMPLTGAVFNLYKKDGENENWPAEPFVVRPGDDEEDIAEYEFINLPDGSYKLVETPPTGYVAAGDVFFTVAGGVLNVDGTLPDGVTMDGDKLLMTVKNSPRTDSLTVRKQWLDVNGNPRGPSADEVTITLKRTVDVPSTKTLRIIVRVRNSSDNGYNVGFDETWNITNESAIVSWYDNRQYNYENRRMSIETSSGVGCTSQADNSNLNRARFRLSNLANVSDSPTITFTYTRSNESWIYNQLSDFRITGDGNTVHFGGDPVEDDWSQSVTLNDENGWSETLTELPADDGHGNSYHYYIVEESVPAGYTVTYGDKNEPGITAGVLTAYNKRISEDVDVTVKKVWVDGTNEDGTPTNHGDSLTVTLSNGQSVTLNEGNHWEATIAGLPRYDDEGNEIPYSWTEDELENGYYLSDSNTVIYDNSVTTTLTNSYSEHYMPEMEIDGVKIWDDDGAENRPASITVRLYKDNVLYKTTTVNPPTGEGADSDQWTFKFTNLPIFNTDENGEATGTLAVYTVEEVLPAGYISDYETTIQQVQATYEAGKAEAHIINSYSAENQLVSENADLGFVVVRHGQDYVVWTPRPLMDGELARIKQAAVGASRQFSGIMNASGDSLTIITGVPKTVKVGSKEAASVYMKDGDVWVRFENPNAQSDIVYGTIPYTYTQIGGESGVTITNVRKTTSISGTKTWVDGGRQHNNAEQIGLKLYRTAKPVTDDSEWEEVTLTATGTEHLSWEGNTYTYSNLPRYADYTSSRPIEYAYRVEETAVNVTEETGTGQHIISYKMENDGNNFINTELTNIEATKTWKDAGAFVNASLINAAVTFELQKKVGNDWIKVEQEGLINPRELSVTETADANAWKAVWRNLPKYVKTGEDIVAVQYRVVEKAAMVDGENIKPDTDPVAAVSEDGKANIDNYLPITINILKVDVNDHTVKLGLAEFELTKVQSLETMNQVTEGQYKETGITSDADDGTKGMLQFTGITPGYYYLHEIKAPDGYVMTEGPGWHFQVDESGIVQGVGDFTNGSIFQYVDAKNITVENTPGAALPNTGGFGTNLIYLIGGILTMLAGAIIVMKRRWREAA
ncbi:MAG: Cna B-type domain-containing protein [Lachnospiraceae bacterium]|nr:Cna B-type domain-containing protein [Lachnospiraceae bacterium]